jgi:hypothetical protein
MHTKEAIEKEIEYNEKMQRKMLELTRKAIKDKEPHETFQSVALEYGAKANALRWVINEGAFHRI